jgi:putative spermidine/putrescine transport system substrate-binding protein
MYNTDAFGGTAPDSWNVVFEEMTLADGQSNKGRVQAYDGPIYVADAALYLMYHNPELGIKDPYALNEDQYKAALDLLRVQRTLIGRYWHDAFVQIDDFKNEGMVASGSWPIMVNLLKADSAPIASVFPKEGVTGWADTTMLHADSEHPNCAYMWMNHSLENYVQAGVSAWFGTVPSVPAACEGSDLLGADGCKVNGSEDFDKIRFWRTPTAKCEQGECVPYYRWVSDYVGVIGGR